MSFKTVVDYIAAQAPDGRRAAGEFTAFMSREFPQLQPKISYSMPMWWVGKTMREGYVGFSAAQKHYTVHFSDEDRIAKIQAELPCCKTGKRCINIRYGDETGRALAEAHVKDHLNLILAAAAACRTAKPDVSEAAAQKPASRE